MAQLEKKEFVIGNFVLWLRDGILYFKNGSSKSYDIPIDIAFAVQEVKTAVGATKVGVLSEVKSVAGLPNKEIREFIGEQLNELTLALAVVSTSAFTRLLSCFFFALVPPSYPVKLFSEKEEAENWLHMICSKQKNENV